MFPGASGLHRDQPDADLPPLVFESVGLTRVVIARHEEPLGDAYQRVSNARFSAHRPAGIRRSRYPPGNLDGQQLPFLDGNLDVRPIDVNGTLTARTAIVPW